MTPAVPLTTAVMLTFNSTVRKKTTDDDHSKIIQVRLSHICLQTLKYSETHRSGGHFDVKLTSRLASQLSSVTREYFKRQMQ